MVKGGDEWGGLSQYSSDVSVRVESRGRVATMRKHRSAGDARRELQAEVGAAGTTNQPGLISDQAVAGAAGTTTSTRSLHYRPAPERYRGVRVRLQQQQQVTAALRGPWFPRGPVGHVARASISPR